MNSLLLGHSRLYGALLAQLKEVLSERVACAQSPYRTPCIMLMSSLIVRERSVLLTECCVSPDHLSLAISQQLPTTMHRVMGATAAFGTGPRNSCSCYWVTLSDFLEHFWKRFVSLRFRNQIGPTEAASLGFDQTKGNLHRDISYSAH